MATTPLPSTGAVSGLGETLAFFTQADFAQRRFETHGDVFETKLLGEIGLGEKGQGFPQSAHGARAGEGGGGHRSSA